jgi:hypothetical protein
LAPRIECSGVPIRARLTGRLATSANGGFFYMYQDGAAILGGQKWVAGGGFDSGFNLEVTFTPTAGSHIIAPYYLYPSGGSSVTLRANATDALILTIEEVVRQNANNS